MNADSISNIPAPLHELPVLCHIHARFTRNWPPYIHGPAPRRDRLRAPTATTRTQHHSNDSMARTMAVPRLHQATHQQACAAPIHHRCLPQRPPHVCNSTHDVLGSAIATPSTESSTIASPTESRNRTTRLETSFIRQQCHAPTATADNRTSRPTPRTFLSTWPIVYVPIQSTCGPAGRWAI